MNSDTIKSGWERAPHRSLLRATGLQTEDFAKPFIGALRKYFRADIVGLEKMPAGKALVVGNHNGGITFFEPFFLGEEWYSRTGELLYYLAHDAMVALPAVGNMLLKVKRRRPPKGTTAEARRTWEDARGNYTLPASQDGLPFWRPVRCDRGALLADLEPAQRWAVEALRDYQMIADLGFQIEF